MTRRSLLQLLGLSSLTTLSAAHATDQLTQTEDDLHDWNKQVRYPVTESTDPIIQQLLSSTSSQHPLAFYYFGGSSPRQLRLATIESVFTVDSSNHRYVTAYCHLRREHRTFRTDRISLA